MCTETLPRNGLHNPVILRLLGADRIQNNFPYTVAHLEVFTDRRIETAVILLLPVFVAMRMFTDIPLLMRNLATDCLPRICLRGNLSTNPLPSNGCTCNNIITILTSTSPHRGRWCTISALYSYSGAARFKFFPSCSLS
jgi:hypothetical protein